MAPDWLCAVPIAHRGLHDRARGIIENTRSAAATAIARGFAIECDVQRSADGEAVVFHDSTLDRLTGETGALAERTSALLGQTRLRDTDDVIVPLQRFLDDIGGTVPVIVEVKSRFDGDFRLADRTAQVIAAARGPIAIKSFDPGVIAHLRGHLALASRNVPRGVVAQAAYGDAEWAFLSAEQKADLSQFLHFERSRPDFLSWRAHDLPSATPFLCRAGLGLPVMTWTIRNAAQARHGLKWADQIVFEGFDPTAPSAG